MGFGRESRRVRDESLPFSHRFLSLNSWIQQAQSIGFEPTWAYLEAKLNLSWYEPDFLLPGMDMLEAERAIHLRIAAEYAELRRPLKAAGHRFPPRDQVTPIERRRWHGDERTGARHARNPGTGAENGDFPPPTSEESALWLKMLSQDQHWRSMTLANSSHFLMERAPRVWDSKVTRFRIGRGFAAEVINTLSPGAGFVATYPAPMDDSEGLARKRVESKLRSVWGEIGFEPLNSAIMILDLNLITLDEKLEGLRKKFGAL